MNYKYILLATLFTLIISFGTAQALPTAHGTYYPENNTCYAQNKGFSILTENCKAQDIDGKDVTQYVTFNWTGASELETDWLFVYTQNLTSGKMYYWGNKTYQAKEYYFTNGTANITLNNVDSYYNAGEPSQELCEYGNEWNDHAFNISRFVNGTTNVSQVYCFNQYGQINSSAYWLKGTYDKQESQQVTRWKMAWKDISSEISFVGSNLLGYGLQYYRVKQVTFQPNEGLKTKWVFTPADSNKTGKWHIFGKKTADSLSDAIANDNYIYQDPWWDDGWNKKMPIHINTTGNPSKLWDVIVRVPITYDSDMNSDFSDIRFLSACSNNGKLINAYNESQIDGTKMLAILNMSNLGGASDIDRTICMYYDNPSATAYWDGNKTFDWFTDFEDYNLGIVDGQDGWIKIDDKDGKPFVTDDGCQYGTKCLANPLTGYLNRVKRPVTGFALPYFMVDINYNNQTCTNHVLSLRDSSNDRLTGTQQLTGNITRITGENFYDWFRYKPNSWHNMFYYKKGLTGDKNWNLTAYNTTHYYSHIQEENLDAGTVDFINVDCKGVSGYDCSEGQGYVLYDNMGIANYSENYTVSFGQEETMLTIPLEVTLDSPSDYSLNIGTVNFNYTPDVVKGGVLNCSLYTNKTNWSLKHTNSTPIVENATNTISETFGSNGHYKWTVSCWNSTTEVFATSNRTAVVDVDKPKVKIQSPANDTYETNSIWFNVTQIQDDDLDSVVVEIGNKNHTLTNSSGNYNYYNDSMSEGTYEATFYLEDTAGNKNSTSIWFTTDLYLTINILNPANETINTSYPYFWINATSVFGNNVTISIFADFIRGFGNMTAFSRLFPANSGWMHNSTGSMTNWGEGKQIEGSATEFEVSVDTNGTRIVWYRQPIQYRISYDNLTYSSDYTLADVEGDGMPSAMWWGCNDTCCNGTLAHWQGLGGGNSLVWVGNITRCSNTITYDSDTSYNITYNGLTKTTQPRTIEINRTHGIIIYRHNIGGASHTISRLYNSQNGKLGKEVNMSEEDDYPLWEQIHVYIAKVNGTIYVFEKQKTNQVKHSNRIWLYTNKTANCSEYQSEGLSWENQTYGNRITFSYKPIVDNDNRFYIGAYNTTTTNNKLREMWLFRSKTALDGDWQPITRIADNKADDGWTEGDIDGWDFGTYSEWTKQTTKTIESGSVVKFQTFDKIQDGQTVTYYITANDGEQTNTTEKYVVTYNTLGDVNVTLGEISTESPIDPVENTTIQIEAFVNATSDDFDAGVCYLYYPNSTLKEQNTAQETAVNATFTTLNCSFSMSYHNVNGSYNITVIANSTADNKDQSDTTFTYNLLEAFALNTTTLNFGTINMGQNETKQFVSINTGNQELNLEMNGTDLTSTGDSIAVGNMTFDDDSDLSDGTTMTTSFQTFTVLSVLEEQSGYINLQIPLGSLPETYSGSITIRSI